MKTLIKEIQKEIAKAEKDLNFNNIILGKIRNIPGKQMTERNFADFNAATESLERAEKILFVLQESLLKLQSI